MRRSTTTAQFRVVEYHRTKVRRYLRTFEGTCKTVSLNRKENNSRERITLSIFPGSRFPKSNWKLVTEIRHEASYEVTFEGTFGTI